MAHESDENSSDSSTSTENQLTWEALKWILSVLTPPPPPLSIEAGDQKQQLIVYNPWIDPPSCKVSYYRGHSVLNLLRNSLLNNC